MTRTTTSRPHLACEITSRGILAARRQPESAAIAAAAFVPLNPALAERAQMVEAVRRALNEAGGRSGVMTLVLPDNIMRVVVLDFDTLPTKRAEAEPIIRFRLKKIVPFETDDTAVGYQTLPGGSDGVRVLAAIMPRAELQRYESIVREAGFEPGVVLPSTLAALPILSHDAPVLVVNSSGDYVTTAIVRGEELLLYRTSELPAEALEIVPVSDADESEIPASPLAQEIIADAAPEHAPEFADATLEHSAQPFSEPAPYAEQPSLYPAAHSHDAEVHAEADDAAPIVLGISIAEGAPELPALERFEVDPEDPVAVATKVLTEREIDMQQAVLIAAAFFEDAVGEAPNPVLIAGEVNATEWQLLLAEDNLRPHVIVSSEDLGTASIGGISRGQMAAVCGAMRS
jgi:type IV pilus assembly protein PilM